MDVERPKAEGCQLDLFQDQDAPSHHDATGDGGTGTGAVEVAQASAALKPGRALTDRLMEEICTQLLQRKKKRRIGGFTQRREQTSPPHWSESSRPEASVFWE